MIKSVVLGPRFRGDERIVGTNRKNIALNVIAGRKARSAVFAPEVPAIHVFIGLIIVSYFEWYVRGCTLFRAAAVAAAFCCFCFATAAAFTVSVLTHWL